MHQLLLIAVMLLACICPVISLASNITAEETKLRAAIVLGILRFSSWPNDVEMASTFNLCTFAEPISEASLIQISGIHKIKNNAISVFRVQANDEKLGRCNALVIGGGKTGEDIKKLLTSNRMYGVLTICDDCQLENNSVMVHLIRNKNRIGFEIDLVEAKKQGVYFSSSLLELAIGVRQE